MYPLRLVAQSVPFTRHSHTRSKVVIGDKTGHHKVLVMARHSHRQVRGYLIRAVQWVLFVWWRDGAGLKHETTYPINCKLPHELKSPPSIVKVLHELKSSP